MSPRERDKARWKQLILFSLVLWEKEGPGNAPPTPRRTRQEWAPQKYDRPQRTTVNSEEISGMVRVEFQCPSPKWGTELNTPKVKRLGRVLCWSRWEPHGHGCHEQCTSYGKGEVLLKHRLTFFRPTIAPIELFFEWAQTCFNICQSLGDASGKAFRAILLHHNPMDLRAFLSSGSDFFYWSGIGHEGFMAWKL